MSAFLYQHQLDGARWLMARDRGLLADVPGLGKTRTLLEATRLDGPTLVVCPAIVRTHWRREAQLLSADAELHVRSYDEIVRGGFPLMRTLLIDESCVNLIVDECHYAKTPGAQRTKIVFGKDGYARRIKRVYAASGTPISKHPAEIWPFLSACCPELCVEHGLRTYEDFVNRFCTVVRQPVRGRWVDRIMPQVRNDAELQEILGAVMLRRTLDDVGLDVPPLDWQITRLDGGGMGVGLSAEEWGVSMALQAGDLADIANDPHVARMRRRLGELKVEPTLALLTELLETTDEKVVVFAHHRDVLARLRTGLEPFGVAYVDGDTSPAHRDEAIDLFQNTRPFRVFLGQNIACQTGITLTAARRVVLVEPDWTNDVNYQLGQRIARIGQRAERCVGQMIALAGTLDEAIIGRNHQEVRMAEVIGLGAR